MKGKGELEDIQNQLQANLRTSSPFFSLFHGKCFLRAPFGLVLYFSTLTSLIDPPVPCLSNKRSIVSETGHDGSHERFLAFPGRRHLPADLHGGYCTES